MKDKFHNVDLSSMISDPLAPQANLVPMVVEQSARGERAYDIILACLRSG